LHQSHCLVLPSEVETFGLALVEAMACGLPVIATRCGGPEDIVTDETGILIPVNDEPALYRAMATMLQSCDKYDAQQIRRYALEKFGAERYVAAFTAVFSELTAAR
jgi:glycosyltransferase involved in cell wall biosynthesis